MIDNKMDNLKSRLFTFAKNNDLQKDIKDTCHEAAITICGLLDTTKAVEAERDEALEWICHNCTEFPCKKANCKWWHIHGGC